MATAVESQIVRERSGDCSTQSSNGPVENKPPMDLHLDVQAVRDMFMKSKEKLKAESAANGLIDGIRCQFSKILPSDFVCSPSERSVGSTCRPEPISQATGADFLEGLQKQFAACADIVTNNDHPDVQHSFTSEDEEAMQMRRLASWNTIGSVGTIGTNYSEATVETLAFVDDDGNPIDPKILEKRREARERQSHRRKRLVKFEYPPVSSLRECPRPDPNDLPQLYFTEEELDQIEADRDNTWASDDIEVIAVASSLSTEGEIHVPPPETPANVTKKFGDYVSTPRKAWGAKKAEFEEEAGKGRAGRSTQREGDQPGWKPKRASTPAPKTRQSPRNTDPRLIKSVQIYLRERSLG